MGFDFSWLVTLRFCLVTLWSAGHFYFFMEEIWSFLKLIQWTSSSLMPATPGHTTMNKSLSLWQALRSLALQTWTKDGSKADLTLNLYARQLAIENLKDNDECFVYLSSCIGKAELPGGLIKTVKNGQTYHSNFRCHQQPSTLIHLFGLDKPIYKQLCRKGLQSLFISEKIIESIKI